MVNEELIVAVSVTEQRERLHFGKVEFLWRENWLQILSGFRLFSVVYWLYDH